MTQKPRNRLKELREAAGLSSRELARLVETTSAQVSRLETGERQLTQHWIERFARALGAEPGDFFPKDPFAEEKDPPAPLPQKLPSSADEPFFQDVFEGVWKALVGDSGERPVREAAGLAFEIYGDIARQARSQARRQKLLEERLRHLHGFLDRFGRPTGDTPRPVSAAGKADPDTSRDRD